MSNQTNGIRTVRRILGRIDDGMNILTGIALVILTFMITTDVVTRFAFNHPLPATTEISELLMAYIVFLTMGYTLSLGIHIRITVLFEYISARSKLYFDLLTSILGFAFCSVLTYYAWKFFMHSFSIREEMLAVIPLPWYAGKFAMPVGFLLFTLHYVIECLETIGTLLEEKTA